MPTSTDLVTDLPADFAVFGQAVDTSMAELKGGTTGQVLSKTSNTDMDFTWITNDVGDITAVTAGTGISGGGTSGAVTVTNSMATAITTAGDLIKGTGSGTFDRLGIGSTGQVLTVASGAPSWATPAASASGLTLVKSQTIGSAVSSVTVTDAFSSTYDNYIVTFSGGSATASGGFKFQLGSTTSGYYTFLLYGSYSGATVNGYNQSNTTFAGDFGYTSANGHTGVVNIQSPNLAARTSWNMAFAALDTTYYAGWVNGFVNNTTQYTAFTLTTGSGTITGGTIRVYGYQNS